MELLEKLSYRLLIPSDLEYIPPIRHFISGIARSHGFNNKACFRAEIIVDELCTNAIIHGNQGKPGMTIQMEVLFDDEKMDLRIKDNGGSEKNRENLKRALYNSNHVQDRYRGKGLEIVHMLSDGLKMNLDEKGNTQVKIIKNKTPAIGSSTDNVSK